MTRPTRQSLGNVPTITSDRRAGYCLDVNGLMGRSKAIPL